MAETLFRPTIPGSIAVLERAGAQRCSEEWVLGALARGWGPKEGNLAIRLEVDLIPAYHHRDSVGVLDAQNLLAEGVDFVEATAGYYTVDDEETLPRAHVLHRQHRRSETGYHERRSSSGRASADLISHRTVLLLTRRVENIENTCFVVDRYLLSITILCICGAACIFPTQCESWTRALSD